MAQRCRRLPGGWGGFLLLGALVLSAGGVAPGCRTKKDDSSNGDATAAGGTAGAADGRPLATADDGGDDTRAVPDDAPPGPPPTSDGSPSGTPPRDGGCLPCPSSHQPACTREVGPKASCSAAGSACCDPDDRFWLCRCVPRPDGGPACSWMNACGG